VGPSAAKMTVSEADQCFGGQRRYATGSSVWPERRHLPFWLGLAKLVVNSVLALRAVIMSCP
jgi:hypothetical protein